MLTIIDLFAGCGGMTLGFQRAGFVPLGGVEQDAMAAQTYARNFFRRRTGIEAERHTTGRDIREFHPADFEEVILRPDGFAGQVDVIIGGPPCQAFARVGRAKLREIMAHDEAYLQDGRANLYLDFLSYVGYFRPRAVVIENVPDIMNYGGKNVAEEIAASLDDQGYRTRYTILNSVYYGVPQMRQRFYLIALREDIGVEPAFPPPTHRYELPPGYKSARLVATNGNRPTPLAGKYGSHYVSAPEANDELPWAVTAEEALGDLPSIDISQLRRGARQSDLPVAYRVMEPGDYATEMRTWPGFESNEGVYDHVTRCLPRDYALFRGMKPGDQYPEALELATKLRDAELDRIEQREGVRPEPGSPVYEEVTARLVPPYDPTKFPNKWRKMERDAPARTLTAHLGKDSYTHIHYDSEQSRVISVREAARLQSFPDGFIFLGGMNAALRQIGNAVPPVQAWQLATVIRKVLEGGMSGEKAPRLRGAQTT